MFSQDCHATVVQNSYDIRKIFAKFSHCKFAKKKTGRIRTRIVNNEIQSHNQQASGTSNCSYGLRSFI